MILPINDNQKLSEVIDDFTTLFPYLKLEFFKHKHGLNESNSKKDMLNTELTFKKVRRKHNDGALLINENMRVSELEQLFQDVFGISAQIFRKSGRSWIETSVTDDWTLKHQNDEGKELSYLSK